MSRIFITGSTDGLGRAAARALLNDGHQVVLHARSQDRTLAFGDLALRSAGAVVSKGPGTPFFFKNNLGSDGGLSYRSTTEPTLL